MNNRVLIIIKSKENPRIFWRTVKWDDKGDYVLIDKEKNYLNNLVRTAHNEYTIKKR